MPTTFVEKDQLHGLEIDAMLRGPDEIGAKKLIISTMKDEAPYILEWLAYHRAIGFTDFLIYTNDCSDGTDLLLDRLEQNKHVTHVRNVVLKRGPHKSALKNAKEQSAYHSADWVYVTDVDEFLNIKIGDGRVDDLIARFPEANAIPVTWRLFSNNGHSSLFPGKCTQIFTDAEPRSPKDDTKGRFVKTLFKPHPDMKRMGLHAPVYKEGREEALRWGALWKEKDPKSDPRRPTENFGYDIAQVNHYAVRSIDAFLMKRDRGRANHVKETLGLEYWTRWCHGGEEDFSIQRQTDRMIEEYQKLVSDPVVAQLQEGGRAFQAQKLDALMQREDFKNLKKQLVEMSPTLQHPIKVTPETEALRVKAPKRHQNRIRMLEMMPKNGRCAESGVWNGGFSGVILEVTQPSELTLIDPWDLLSAQDEDEWTHKKHQNHEFMRGMFENVSMNYSHLPNVSIRKGFSAEVLETFPDNYFDWLYIDGNHLYEFVRKDVEVSFRKVRPGGIIAGDDFFWKKDGRTHVKEAVLDAMKDRGITTSPPRIGQQFMITVPE
jgi:hypothetical protein